jgi:hypothetical protein
MAESFDLLKAHVLEDIVWTLGKLMNHTKTQAVKNCVVLIVRQLSTNTKDLKSIILTRMVADLILRNIDGWYFQPLAGEYFSSLVFIKFLRLIEDHF